MFEGVDLFTFRENNIRIHYVVRICGSFRSRRSRHDTEMLYPELRRLCDFYPTVKEVKNLGTVTVGEFQTKPRASVREGQARSTGSLNGS
jgi:hypothetical protein